MSPAVRHAIRASSLVPGLRWLYNYAWFVGFGIAGALYLMLMRPMSAAEPVHALSGEEV